METLSIIITIISAIAAVLQIILFFKIWRMCDDINAIRNKEVPMPEDEKKNDEAGKYLGFVILIISSLIIMAITVAKSI